MTGFEYSGLHCNQFVVYSNNGDKVYKENYSVDKGQPGKPVSVTAMIKLENSYDDTGVNGFFIQFYVEENILLSEAVPDLSVKRSCFNCHKNIAERDYISSTFYTDNPG